MDSFIDNRNPYNIIHVVFASFHLTILFLKEGQQKFLHTTRLRYPFHRTLYRVY